jgi:hypothetical protein
LHNLALMVTFPEQSANHFWLVSGFFRHTV